MGKRARTAGGAAVPATVLATVLALAPSRAGAADGAQAARDQCGAGQLCVWEDDGWKGCFARLPEKDADWTDGSPSWANCPAEKTVNDEVSSYVNNTGNWVGFWRDRRYHHANALCVGPGASSGNLNRLRHGEFLSFEDRISAHATFHGGRPSFAFPDEGYCESYDGD